MAERKGFIEKRGGRCWAKSKRDVIAQTGSSTKYRKDQMTRREDEKLVRTKLTCMYVALIRNKQKIGKYQPKKI